MREWMNTLVEANGILVIEDKSADGNLILKTSNPKIALTGRRAFSRTGRGKGKGKGGVRVRRSSGGARVGLARPESSGF